MKHNQEFLTVWYDGESWFDFPTTNEQEVMDMLVKNGKIDKCIFLPKGEVPTSPKVVTIQEPVKTTIKPKTK